MALESMIAPVPSELVMPFAGFLAANGTFTFAGVVIASGLGSIAGSLLSYYAGRIGGKPLVLRLGRYLLLDASHLEATERYFARHGEKTIFIARLIPVVRHLISIPAGIGRMPIGRFILYTVAGATLWNAFLAWLGMLLRSEWHRIHDYSRIADFIIVGLGIIAVAWLIRRRILHARATAAARQETV